MGKHEVIKPSSTARVQKHRAEMRAKGLQLRQIWTPRSDDPALIAEIERANRVIAANPEVEANVVAWIDGVTSGIGQVEPDYKW